MRFGENNRNITAEELAVGRKAARTLSRNLKNILGLVTTKQTGTLLKTTGASAKMKFDALDRIEIRSTSVSFIQHYGFEGIKKNGVAMSLKPTDHFNKLLTQTNALETLADEIGALRAEEVTAKMNF